MSEALERLSKIKNTEQVAAWAMSKRGYEHCLPDIQEIVALAKANQQPSIDAMRFEAAKDFIAAEIKHKGIEFLDDGNIEFAANAADALIAELQKLKQ